LIEKIALKAPETTVKTLVVRRILRLVVKELTAMKLIGLLIGNLLYSLKEYPILARNPSPNCRFCVASVKAVSYWRVFLLT